MGTLGNRDCQRPSRCVLKDFTEYALTISLEWKLANSAKAASKKIFPHVNRNIRLTARILQLRHPSGSLINSDQEMAELLITTFL